jgi:hypothetical protein
MTTYFNRRAAKSAAACVAFMTAAVAASKSDAAVITEFNFEGATIVGGTSPATTYGPLAANIGTGSFTAVHANSSAYTYAAGNGTTQAFNSNNWSSGDYYQFTSPGFAGLQLEFAQTSSSTGPLSFNLLYSTDGSTFNTFDTYAINPGISFSTGTAKTTSPPLYLFDFTGNSAVTAASTVTFRLSAATAGSGAAGTDRVDTIDVGTNLPAPAVPEPATLSIAALTAAGLLGRRRARR